MAGLEHQRDIGDGDPDAGRQIREPLPDVAVDLGMDDGFEIGARLVVGKYDPPERASIQCAVRAPARRAETADDRRERRRARRDGLPSEQVGVDAGGAERREAAKAVRLARRNAAGERDPQHRFEPP